MTGEVHWLPIAVILVAAIPIVYLFVRERREARKYQVEQERVRCRTRGNQLAECTLVRDAATGAPIGIRECTAWAGKEGAHCEQTCLPLFQDAPASPPQPLQVKT